jgi:LPXTG-site transpeptidase (sortase) family protein
MWIEIPSLNMQSTVVGVPVTESGWDVSWLGKSTGWLNGTAYPTHLGNSVLTAHINDTNGHPGPFASIDKLKYGDQIIIHAWNQKYIYEVRETKVISATNNSEALKHKDLSWITLLTCRDYDEKTGTYLERYLVRAVLIKVQ